MMTQRYPGTVLALALLAQLLLVACAYSQDSSADSTQATPAREIQVNYNFESLSNGYGDWRTVTLDFSRRYKSRQVVYGSLLATERFRRRDQQMTIGVYQPLSRKWSVQLEASVSPTHKTLSKWTASVGVEHNLPKGWNVQANYRRTHYREAKVNLASTGLEKYFGNYRAAYTLYVSNLTSGGTSASHRAQFNRYYGEHSSNFGVSGSFGKEIESLGPGRVLQTSVAGVAVSGSHWLNGRLGLNYNASVTRQGRFYVRRGVNLGIRFRF